jgi:hypothetical protein
MRAFVRLREMIAAHKDLAERIEKLEAGHEQHASIIDLLVEEIRIDQSAAGGFRETDRVPL